MDKIELNNIAALVLRHQVHRIEEVLAEPGWKPQTMADAALAVHDDLLKVLVLSAGDTLDGVLGRLASWRYRHALTAELVDAAEALAHREIDAARGDRLVAHARDHAVEPEWIRPLLEQHTREERQRQEMLRRMDAVDLRLWATSQSRRKAAAVWLLTESSYFAELKLPVGDILLRGTAPSEPLVYLGDMGLREHMYIALAIWNLAGNGSYYGVGTLMEHLDAEHQRLLVQAMQLLVDPNDEEEGH